MESIHPSRPGRTARSRWRLACAVALGLALGGCSPLQSEHFWRRDDGAGFVLQYNLDLVRKEISFIELQLPSEHEVAPARVKPVRNIDDCQFSDAENWNCEDRGYGDEQIYMLKGQLHYNFFGEYRKYELRNVLLRRLSPCLSTDFAACKRAVLGLVGPLSF